MIKPAVVLNVNDLWIRQPFQALGKLVPTVGLRPEMHDWRWLLPARCDGTRTGWVERRVYLPSRSLGRFSDWLAPLAERSVRAVCRDPGAVILTYPDQRSFASRFADAVRIYYVADDFRSSYGWPADTVASWERRIVGEMDCVVAVSRALAQRFQSRYALGAERIHVSPNGVAAEFIPASPPARPGPAPPMVPAHFRPLAGVIGSISHRIRLQWIRQAVDGAPWLYWVFVGPVGEMDAAHRSDLEVLQSHPRCRFVGRQPYRALFSFAAAVDVALIPFEDSGINPACSPVRFFTQLPFGQPILTTPGCAQLEEFQPLVRLCRTADELIQVLSELRADDFDDGLRHARWATSQQHTWEARAVQLVRLVAPGA